MFTFGFKVRVHSLLRVLCAVLLTMSAAQAQNIDIADAKDSGLLTRPAGAWIVNYQNQEVDDYILALGSVEKVNGLERLEKEQRLKGSLSRISYRIPEGRRLKDHIKSIDQQLEKLGAETLFSCTGRDCGSSNFWANQVFNYSKLYGVERNQYYLAAKMPGVVVVLYLVERGNRRQYLHLDVLETDAVARKMSEFKQLGYVELSVDALPSDEFIAKVLGALAEQQGEFSTLRVASSVASSSASNRAGRRPAMVVHHQGDDLESALAAANTQAEQLKAMLIDLSRTGNSSENVSVHAVGAWVPSVLRGRKMVVELIAQP